ncbi:MAG: MerR family transcriptional regulator, partial [Myxococcota bacterium]|nr:MerR family transcriptional regulator [Myxococcota bacterium]
MSEETWTRDELFEDRDLAPAFVTELQRLGLLRIVARDATGEPLYAPDAREELDKVLALVEMGYEPKDIAAIARKVGLPPRQRTLFRRPPVCISLDALVERSEVERATIEDWVAHGVIAPRLISERGVALFSVAQVEQVRLLDDLTQLGADEHEVEVAAKALNTLTVATAAEDDAGPDAEALVELARVLEDLNEFLGRRRRATRRWTRS